MGGSEELKQPFPALSKVHHIHGLRLKACH